MEGGNFCGDKVTKKNGPRDFKVFGQFPPVFPQDFFSFVRGLCDFMTPKKLLVHFAKNA